MAAPVVASVMGTPEGIKLDDGYQTIISFALDPNISLWEKTVQPPGLDGGDAVDTTTMRNTTYRTSYPRALVTMTDMSITAAYDPIMLIRVVGGTVDVDSYPGLINKPTTITVEFPDGSKWAFFGFLRSFTPQDHEEGTQPTATVVITPMNQDPSSHTEESPVLENAAGT